MKCLTYVESEEWLAASAVKITEHRQLAFPTEKRKARRTLIVSLPKEPLRIGLFSDQLMDWLPNGCGRMLWLSTWRTYPPNQPILFKTVRRGCGESRHIIDAPGHLFELSAYNGYENRTPRDVQENAILAGFVLLMICFDWEGYIVTQNHDDYILLGDAYIEFFSTSGEKVKEASSLAEKFHLELR
jgi:hypothetical protein